MNIGTVECRDGWLVSIKKTKAMIVWYNRRKTKSQMKSTKSKGYFGFGVLDTSERYRTWEEMHGEPYYAYRREWAERPTSYSYGDFPLSINVVFLLLLFVQVLCSSLY